MAADLISLVLPMPFHLGSVNCYLLRTAAGYLLIDSGMPSGRRSLERQLDRAGCRPGNLALILLTHGDFDHIGNAAYLRQRYGAKIAMHPGDAGMAERADMFWNRGKGSALVRQAAPALLGFTRRHRFTPDVWLEEGFDLGPYGLAACVLSTPGHSSGSISILTAEGDLFCGDLWMHDRRAPRLGFGDPAAFAPAVRRIRGMRIATVYPGHGTAFSLEQVETSPAVG